jgi:hypothetical protein
MLEVQIQTNDELAALGICRIVDTRSQSGLVTGRYLRIETGVSCDAEYVVDGCVEAQRVDVVLLG